MHTQLNRLKVISTGTVLITALSGLALPGCDRPEGTGTNQTSSSTNGAPRNPTATSTPAVTPAPAPAPTPAPAPDNTARNERDRNANNPTPLDQGESETDRRITADIRRAVLAEKGLSVNAQNCKIITRNGIVTLRGPVTTTTELDVIEARAKAIAGVTSVVNELEVTGK